jgi:lipopolysaccharide assembly protein A
VRRSSRDPNEPSFDADREHQDQLRRVRQTRLAKAIVILTLLVLLAIFVIKNSHPVAINYVFLTRDTRLIWIMLACAVVGFVIGYLVGRPGKAFRFHDEND